MLALAGQSREPKFVVRPPTRRGLCRVEAAEYVGVSPTLFDQMVSDGRMPWAKRVNARRIWDVRALDLAFDALPGDGNADNNPWDS